VTFISIGAILLRYSLWLPVLLLAAVDRLFRLAAAQRRYHEWWKETTSNRRWTNYSMGCDVARRRRKCGFTIWRSTSLRNTANPDADAARNAALTRRRVLAKLTPFPGTRRDRPAMCWIVCRPCGPGHAGDLRSSISRSTRAGSGEHAPRNMEKFIRTLSSWSRFRIPGSWQRHPGAGSAIAFRQSLAGIVFDD